MSSETIGAASTVTSYDDGIYARNDGSGATTIAINGNITSSGNGVRTRSLGAGGFSLTTGAGSTIAGVGGNGGGIYAENASGAMTFTINGDVIGDEHGILAKNVADTELSITTAAGTTISGETGIAAVNYAGSETLRIAVRGDVTGTSGLGIAAAHYGGGAIDVSVGAAGNVTSNGVDNTGFAVNVFSGPVNLTVAGALNGGGGSGGAARFDQVNAFDDRLELHRTATIDGDVLAGPGTDTLAFGGAGSGTFNLADIDTGAGTQQFQDFETGEVDSGTWRFSGATTLPFTVEGGTLKGTGTFGDLTVNGGKIAPGNSIGTMTVNGAFTLGSGSVFEVEVDAAGNNDKVIVNGTVNLTGATLRVLAANGDYNDKTEYVIIENDGSDAVNGVFARVTSSLAFLIPTVVYNGGTGNDVVLNLVRNDVDPCDVANTPDERATCNAIGPDNPLFLNILGQTAEGARQAFDALSGEIHATVSGVLADDSRYVREAVLGRLMQANHTGGGVTQMALAAGGPQVASLDSQAMALGYPLAGGGNTLNAVPAPYAAPGAPLAFWTSAFGAWADFDTDGNAASADRDLGGFISGMDANIGGSWRAGLATGASFSNVDVDDRHSAADVQSYHLGVYAGGMASGFALRSGGMWAWNDIETSRAVIFPGFFERQKASYDADTGQLFGEVAYPTLMGSIALEPFGGIAYVAVDTERFRERGGPLASLRGLDLNQDVGYSTVGLRAATTMHWGAMRVTPHISAAWQHAFSDVTPGAALAFATTGAAFDVTGVPLAEDSALLDVGLDFALGASTTAGVSYSGQFADNVTDNAVKGRFTWLF